MCFRALILKAALLLALLAPARADDLDDFNRAVEAAMSHHRAAFGYLRTGNIDLAVAGDRGPARDVGPRAGPAPPRDLSRPAALHHGDARSRDAPRRHRPGAHDGPRRRRGAVAGRDPRLARTRYAVTPRPMVLADCILDSNRTMEVLFVGREYQMTLSRPEDAEKIARLAKDYDAVLRRCDAMAPPLIGNHAEFRRLIDGALASLAQFPKAFETRDDDLLYRLMNELRLVRQPAGLPLRMTHARHPDRLAVARRRTGAPPPNSSCSRRPDARGASASIATSAASMRRPTRASAPLRRVDIAKPQPADLAFVKPRALHAGVRAGRQRPRVRPHSRLSGRGVLLGPARHHDRAARPQRARAAPPTPRPPRGATFAE